MANVLLTEKCVRSCPYCFAKEHMDESDKQMLFWQDLIYIVDLHEISGDKAIALLGGEPTLHPDFVDFVLSILERNFHVNIFTSGVFSPGAKYVFAVGQGGTSCGNCHLWVWKTGKLVKFFNHTGKKIELVSWHPNGGYIAHEGHDPYIYVYRAADIKEFGNDAIPVAYKVWAGDHAEYIDFNKDGSFLVSAHQNGLVKLQVWMGENSDLNARRHEWVRTQQTDAEKE